MERKQIGCEVDAETYERFKEYVAKKHGSVRGNLGSELDAAMENRMAASGPNTRLQRIEDDVAHVKRILAESDGAGSPSPTPTPTPSNAGDGHTHTDDDGSAGVSDGRPFDAPASKPHAKATVGQKARWLLAGEADDGLDPSDGAVSRRALHSGVVDAWGLNDDAATGVVDAAVRILERDADAAPHPSNDTLFLWGDRLADVRADLRDDVDDDLDDLDAGGA